MKPIKVNVEISNLESPLRSEVIVLEPHKEVEFEFTIPYGLERCKNKQHFCNINFVFTTDFDDEKEMLDDGFRFVVDLAQYLVKNIETKLNGLLLDCYWACAIDLACEVTRDNIKKTANDYEYTEDDVRGYYGRPRTLENHTIAFFRGVERAIPNDLTQRKVLIEKYHRLESEQNFKSQEFWDDYVWSQLKKEKIKLLKEVCFLSSALPKQNNGKIKRMLDISLSRCRICYLCKNEPFSDAQLDADILPIVSFQVTFRRLSDLVIPTGFISPPQKNNT